ncbi:MAG: aspartate aminotransferase family protein [Alcaligenaceae bacterium]|nr:aspartate aminotransferase family protein [Alcaligenaceae bacterium SAGV5]MPS52042.1 aspartate aminotransferase family protein [Alcaligenaceae bacterium SAGV3]MPT60043.1 aspartate aminotransferase family protein [Alcaligenaceae bacterium]
MPQDPGIIFSPLQGPTIVFPPDTAFSPERSADTRETGLDAYWMPFTGNRDFKAHPRMIVAASGAYYTDADGRQILDGLSGLWTCGLGHGHPKIVEAVARQAATLDYAPAFQFGHPLAFELAGRIAGRMPAGLDHVFFVGSGSEAVDTSLKMARAYWRLKGQPSKTLLIGRARGYHGVNFGGISVGGIGGNRKLYGEGLRADHLPHTLLAGNAFSRGQPAQGAELADELLELIALHDASNIAAVIVEPFAGSAGVIVPPVGYLARLREICTRHDILLIFDEVITAFGRLGAWTGADCFGTTPDILNFAKQVTNGVIPMGGVVASPEIHQVFMQAGGPAYGVEFPHGHTYSAHPIACAAALATLDVLEQEDALGRVRALAPGFESAVHGLRGCPHVTDIRNIGLAAGLTIAPKAGEPARRPYEIAMHCWKQGVYVRFGADTIQLAPPFIVGQGEIDRLVETLERAIRATS